jgi:glycosyltransferase involved in cell wall biosynthesis
MAQAVQAILGLHETGSANLRRPRSCPYPALMAARAAILTPFAAPSVRGNAITVARIVRGLAGQGVEIRVWDQSVTPDAVIAAEVEAFAPSIVHAFHAWRVGPLALRLARRAETPLVVTLTGTDVNHDLFDPERAAVVRHVLEGAARIVVFHESIGSRVSAALPDLHARLVTVPQAADLDGDERFDLTSVWPELPPSRVLFAFPAGIRSVKRPRMPLVPFDDLAVRHPSVRLLYAGPVLDADEGAALLAGVATRPWARYVGTVRHAAMPSLLAQADVVLNCSLSEGGMANSILEAFATGRAVLAADIEGNRSLVDHEVSGLLFRDEAGLASQAERLVLDTALRGRLAAAGRARATARWPPSREIEGYLAVYRALALTPER